MSAVRSEIGCNYIFWDTLIFTELIYGSMEAALFCATADSALHFFCVFLRSQKMERHIRLVADDPTVVTRRTGRNVEQRAGWTLVCRVTINRKRGATGQNQA